MLRESGVIAIVEIIMDDIKRKGHLRGGSFLSRGVFPLRSDTNPNAIDGKGCFKYGNALRAPVISSGMDTRQIKTREESAYGD